MNEYLNSEWTLLFVILTSNFVSEQIYHILEIKEKEVKTKERNIWKRMEIQNCIKHFTKVISNNSSKEQRALIVALYEYWVEKLRDREDDFSSAPFLYPFFFASFHFSLSQS